MQRTRMLILALVALALSAVVTFLIYRELNSRMQTEEVATNRIVVAAQPLTVGMRVEPQHLKVVDWPGEVTLGGSYSTTEEVVGRGVLYPISTNEPVLDAKLAAKGSGAGLAATIPEGKRAVAVRVDDVVGVAGFVLPGTRVDIILSGSVDGPGINVSKVVLENVQVLSAGQNVEYDSAGKPQRVNVVTVLVTPEEAQKLTLATIDGRIRLALRNPLDLETAQPPPTRRAQLYEGAGAPQPQRPAPIVKMVRRSTPPPAPVARKTEAFEVELIQGGDRQTLQFQDRAQSQGQEDNGSQN